SDKIDRIVTNRFLAIPIFALVMFIVYYISISSIGGIVTDWTNNVLFGDLISNSVTSFLQNINCAPWLISLIVDGAINGVGAVLGFAPQMAILFLFLTLLEDCGYMSRIAFVMDKIFRKFGLSGKSVIPLLIGTGCGVPGIMASKTIESDNDRRMTIITTTFIPCGAKLPVIFLIATSILGGAWWVAPIMYFVGVVAVLISAVMLKKTKFFSESETPFVMELPAYHMPSVRNVLLHVWERLKGFFKKAGTVLFVGCVIMWFISSYGIEKGSFCMVQDGDNSFIAYLGRCISWLFIPLGWGNWEAVASMLSGFVAKESIVSTIAVISGVSEHGTAINSVTNMWLPSVASGLSFLVFNLLNSPCIAAISTMHKEMQSRKWFLFALLYQNVFAYLVCLMIYQFLGVITGAVSPGIFTFAAILTLCLMIFQIVRPNPNIKGEKKALKTRR
ncbi:MAG: ferrous iron transport protein B, partial [Acutalibacteraceae bacterium]